MDRVVVVDDHPVVLDGIRTLLAGEDDIEIVGQAQDGQTGLELVTTLQPDAVVLDLLLGDGGSPDTCRSLLRAAPRTRVLMHTAFAELEPLRACLRWGAAGVVFKDGRNLVEALRAVLAGRTYVEPRLTELRPRRVVPGPGQERPEQLSPREYDVLCGYALGQSTLEVAASLQLAESTVRAYTKSMLAKLRSHSRLQALATARRLHLLP